jgi:hypothetical protein
MVAGWRQQLLVVDVAKQQAVGEAIVSSRDDVFPLWGLRPPDNQLSGLSEGRSAFAATPRRYPRSNSDWLLTIAQSSGNV